MGFRPKAHHHSPLPPFPFSSPSSPPSSLSAKTLNHHRPHQRHHPTPKRRRPISPTMLRIAKLKPFPNPPIPHNLIQRFPVSGTAKGKAKIKAGQTLKRSKITTKKQGSESGPTGSRDQQEQEKLYDACLNAPTPVRYLNAKQRAREIEREKMGLISKERQREIEIMKRKDDKLKVSEEPTIIGTPGLDYITLGLVDAEKIPKYQLTVEDGRKLAKEYSRVMMKQHRERQVKESTLLRLKKEAIEALPEGLREAALVPDLTPFPKNRVMALLTPPIEGYVDQIREAAKKMSGTEKIR